MEQQDLSVIPPQPRKRSGERTALSLGVDPLEGLVAVEHDRIDAGAGIGAEHPPL